MFSAGCRGIILPMHLLLAPGGETSFQSAFHLPAQKNQHFLCHGGLCTNLQRPPCRSSVFSPLFALGLGRCLSPSVRYHTSGCLHSRSSPVVANITMRPFDFTNLMGVSLCRVSQQLWEVLQPTLNEFCLVASSPVGCCSSAYQCPQSQLTLPRLLR